MAIKVYDDEGDEIQLPLVWEICGTCRGHGTSSAYLGAITSEEWERDWDEDERETYLRGGYDRPCDTCNGSGKVQVVDWDNLTKDQRERYERAVEEEMSYRAMCDAERRAGC